MKALSIKQPWASLIAHGIKDIENRTWKTHFRGRIYIHAGKTTAKFTDLLQHSNLLQIHSNSLRDNLEIFKTYPHGAIIGEVDIIDCVINHDSVWAENVMSGEQKLIYNWILANPVLYEKPILNVKGKLSFWFPDTDIMECIGCSQKFDSEFMEKDDSNEKYCAECWEEMLPAMLEEIKEISLTELCPRTGNDCNSLCAGNCKAI